MTVLRYMLVVLCLLVEATPAFGAPVVAIDGGVHVPHVALEVPIRAEALSTARDGTGVWASQGYFLFGLRGFFFL